MTYALFALYGLVLVAIGFSFRKHATANDFLIGKRKLGWLSVAASIFTLIGGGELAALSTFSFLYGNESIFLFVGYSIGFVLLGLLAQRIKRETDQHNMHSLPDYFYEKYGTGAGLISTAISILAFLALLVIQYSAGGYILSSLTSLDYGVSVGLCGFIVLGYLVLGGFKSVIATDVLQGIIMLTLLPILWIATKNVDYTSVTADGSLGINLILSLTIAGIFTALASADVWQRICAAKNAKSAFVGLTVAAVLFIVFGFGIIEIGEFVKAAAPTTNPDNAFVEGVTQLLPQAFSTFILLLVFSAILSTADTEVFLLSTLVTREFSRWRGGYKSNIETSNQLITSHAKFCLVFVSLIAMILAVFFSNLTSTYIFLLGLILVLSPTLLIGLFVTINRKVAFVSLLLTLITFFITVLTGLLTADNLALILIPGFIFTLLTLVYKQ